MGFYDHEPAKGPSTYLRLKDKDDTATIRIASPPYRKPTVWTLDSKRPTDEQEVIQYDVDDWMRIYREPDFDVKETYLWLVIDRDDGNAKIFSSTPMVYKAIKALAQTDGWGDPEGYDITVTRTENAGSYYTVMALPKMDPLTQGELAKLSKLDMKDKEPCARTTDQPQIDALPAEFTDPEGTAHNASVASDNAATAAAVTKKREDDTVITDGMDDPINLDDIPFGGKDNPPENPAK